MRRLILFAIVLAVPSLALSQTSTNFKLTESAFNNGGDPLQGNFASSFSHRVKLDAIGGTVASGLASASHHLDGGFVASFPPPGEVAGLLFLDSQTMVWSPDRAVGVYEVYRDPLSALASGATGACFAAGLASETTTDASVPMPGNGYFYLVTARNRLGEEGTKGYRSGGLERPNPLPCP
jgi:hypothetical protein